MSGGLAARLPTSVEELRALVVELVEVNAGLRKVIVARDHQIAAQERRIAVQDERIAELERRLRALSTWSCSVVAGMIARLLWR